MKRSPRFFPRRTFKLGLLVLVIFGFMAFCGSSEQSVRNQNAMNGDSYPWIAVDD